MAKITGTVSVTLPFVVLVFLATVWKTADTLEMRVAVFGKVTFTGAVPPGELIDMESNAYCAGIQATTQNRFQPVSTGAGEGLHDVIVYVKEGWTETDGGEGLPAVLLDQKDCMYRPSLVAMRTSQQLLVRNSDATLHNVHVYASENRGFNIGQPFQGVESRRSFQTPEIGIEVKCDVHRWMAGSIAVFDHGSFALTDESGNFSVENLPPGEYVFEAWHRVLGTKTQSVTITGGDVPELHFAFES